MHSDWACTREGEPPTVRLGLRGIAGLKEASAKRLVEARHEAPFDDGEDLARRAQLEQHELRLLAGADALASLAGHRRQQVWGAAALRKPPRLLQEARFDEEFLEMPEAPDGEEIVFDYHATGLTLRRHPLALLRERLRAKHVMTAEQLMTLPNGRRVRTAGIVTLRSSRRPRNERSSSAWRTRPGSRR